MGAQSLIHPDLAEVPPLLIYLTSGRQSFLQSVWLEEGVLQICPKVCSMSWMALPGEKSSAFARFGAEFEDGRLGVCLVEFSTLQSIGCMKKWY